MTDDDFDRALTACLKAFAHDGNFSDTIGAIKNIARLHAADRIEALESRLAGETLAADSLFQKYRQAKSDLLKARRDALEEAARAAYQAWMDGVPVADIPDAIRALKEKE